MTRIAWSIYLLLLSSMMVFAQPDYDLDLNPTPLTIYSSSQSSEYLATNFQKLNTSPATFKKNTLSLTTEFVETKKASASVSANAMAAPNATITAQTTACFGQANGTATVTASAGTPGYTYSWNTSPVQTSATASGLAAGTYTVTVTDAISQTATATVTITQAASPLQIYAHGTAPSCTGLCNGTATVDVVGGAIPYQFSWSNGASQIATSQSISSLCAGTYTVTVTDANGCISSGSSTPPGCFQIQGILVNSCSVTEWYEEMVFFQLGSSPLNASALTVTWPSLANTWRNQCLNSAYIAAANATITGGGSLIAVPIGGTIPANANVVLITENNLNAPIADFSNLAGPLYVIFQCSGNTEGHFGNNGAGLSNPLILNFGGACSQTVNYTPNSLPNFGGSGDGGYVLYSSNGNPNYLNYGCSIPYTIQTNSVTLSNALTPAPTVSNVSYCIGATATPLTATGTNLLWYAAAIGGTGNTTAPTPSTTLAGTTTYYVSQTVGTCESSRSAITVTVGSTQSATISYAGSPFCKSISSAQAVTFSGALGGTYSSTTGLTINASTGAITPSTSTAGSYTVTYSVAAVGGCPAVTTSTPIQILAQPTVTAPASGNICSGSNPNLALTSTTAGVTFNWTYSGGASGSGTGTPINNVLTNATCGNIIVNYSITATINGCVGPAISIPVTVKPKPTSNFTLSSDTICLNENVIFTYTGISCAGNTFTNTFTSATIVSGTGFGPYTLSWSSPGTYPINFQVTNPTAACTAPTFRDTVVVKALPIASFSGSSTICSNQTTALSLSSSIVGTTYAWTVIQSGVTGASNGSGSTIAQTLSTTGASAGTAVYTVTPTANGCAGLPISITVTVNPIPVVSSSGTTTICSNQTTALTLSSTIVGTTYAWTVVQTNVTGASAGTGASISQALTTTGASAGTAVYTVTPTANGCAGTPITITVTVNPLPNAGTNGTITVCSNSTSVNLFNSLLSSPSSGGSWSATPSVLGGGSLGTFVPGTNTAGTYTYSLTTNGCTSNANVVVTVNPAAVVNAGPAQSVCSGGSVTLAGSVTGGASTGTWSAPSGTFSNVNSLTSTYTPSITSGTISLTLSSDPDGVSGPCVNTTSTVVITVNPTPNVTTSGTTSICSNQTTALPLASLVVGASFSWTVVQSGVTGASDGSGNSIAQTLTNVGIVPGTAVYTVTPIANGCSGTPTPITVTVKPLPIANFSGTTPICSPGSPAISLNSNLSGTSYTWTFVQTGVSGASSGSGNSINQTLTATGTVNGTAVYTVTPTANLCAGATLPITITVKPKPVASTLGSSYSICSGPTLATAGSTSINVSSNLASTSFSWTGTNGSSGTSVPLISGLLPNSTCADQIITYSVTPTSNGCVGSALTIPLTVHPNPIAAFTVSASTICQNSSVTVNFTGTACPTSSYNWTWPLGAIVSGSGAGPYSVSFPNSGSFNITLSLTNPGGSCPAVTSTETVTVNPAATVAIGAFSLAICSESTINLPGSFGGGATSATWSAPSGTFGNANLAVTTYTPSITSGPIIITLTTNDPDGSGPCSAVSTSRTLTVTQRPNATISYPSSAYCRSEITEPSPIIVGTPGGTFSASPFSGLSMLSTGQIYPAFSAPFTYIVTYTIAASGGCPLFATSTQVTIYNQPPAPVIAPTSICAGIPQTIVASNGNWFGFSVNGVEVQAPSANNTYITPALALNSQVCVTSYPPSPFVFDGLMNESFWGPEWANSSGGPATSFGANNIDALYLIDRSGYLFGGIAGRVQNNSNNRVLLFLDTKAGGFNSLAGWTNRTNAPYYSIENLNSGITFDPGFAPDYIMGINQAFGITYFDLYDMQNNTNVLLGDDISSNFLGYTPNSGTGNYGAGFEFAIPMNAIGNPASSIQAFVMLVNDPGVSASTTLSNQFLTRANSGDLNYGNGAVNFGSAAPNPITYTISQECSTQTCIIASSSSTTVTGFSYISPLCQNATNPSPTFVSGYTPGGIFSANLPGLSINPTTGLINLAASSPGTYIITYSVAATSCSLAGSSTFSFTINPSPTPVSGFSYTTPVCKNGVNPVVIPGSGFTSGGTYSYIAVPSGLSTGLSLNTSTGAINLGSSTPGTYTVTYTIAASGCQLSGNSSFTITINPLPTISPIYHD